MEAGLQPGETEGSEESQELFRCETVRATGMERYHIRQTRDRCGKAVTGGMAIGCETEVR